MESYNLLFQPNHFLRLLMYFWRGIIILRYGFWSGPFQGLNNLFSIIDVYLFYLGLVGISAYSSCLLLSMSSILAFLVSTFYFESRDPISFYNVVLQQENQHFDLSYWELLFLNGYKQRMYLLDDTGPSFSIEILSVLSLF